MKKTFDQTGTFEAIGEAKKYLTDNGYSYGSMQGSDPVSILKGDYYIEKWRNLSPGEKRGLDGTITGTDKRNGPVTVEIFEGDDNNEKV